MSAQVGEVLKGEGRQIVKDIVHDLSTPLYNILGILEAPSPDLDQLKNSYLHLELLVGKLQDPENYFHLVKSPRILQDLIATAASLTQGCTRGVTVEWDPKVGTDLSIDCDGLKLVQILVNLISNGIKFSPDGGVVRIVVEPIDLGHQARIEELSPEKGRDAPTAKGRQVPCRNSIDSSANSAVTGRDCARAVVQFSVVNQRRPGDPDVEISPQSSQNTHMRSNRIGLRVMQEFVCLMGGDSILGKSTPERTTTFSFELIFEKKRPMRVEVSPAVRDRRLASPPLVATPSPLNTPMFLERKDMHFLVADDDGTTRKQVDRILKTAGARRVSLYASGEEALENRAPVDFIMLDNRMGNLSGVETALAMLQRGALPPTVIITGVHDSVVNSSERELLNHLVVLHKPVRKLIANINLIASDQFAVMASYIGSRSAAWLVNEYL
jgi:CheY-like chemotaxis protein